jgi:hypothetical protein
MDERTPSRQSYSHTQRGPLCLILYASAAGCLAVGLATRVTEGIFAAGGAALVIAGLAPAFHYLRVKDEGDALAIRFGPLPLFSKRVGYADLEQAEVGRTMILDGWGIHLSARGGWVWNLWGRDCVVLHTKQGILRIGTDDGARLVDFLQRRLAGR